MSRQAAFAALFLFASSMVSTTQVFGDWRPYWRKDNQYYTPMIADIRRTHNHMRTYSAPPVRFTNPANALPGAEHRFWDVGLGETFSIVGVGDEDPNWNGTGMGKRFRNGVGAFFDGSAHMLLDFKAQSAAVINTDFRIGGGFMGRYKHLSAKIRKFHECTHLGDEFVIDAQSRHPDFERYNVSSNPVEFFIAYDSFRTKKKKVTQTSTTSTSGITAVPPAGIVIRQDARKDTVDSVSDFKSDIVTTVQEIEEMQVESDVDPGRTTTLNHVVVKDITVFEPKKLRYWRVYGGLRNMGSDGAIYDAYIDTRRPSQIAGKTEMQLGGELMLDFPKKTWLSSPWAAWGLFQFELSPSLSVPTSTAVTCTIPRQRT